MPGLSSAIGKVASFTVKGAAVTFGSTVFSCAAACGIERGANRMIYNYFPHKFANVDAANGITQEELDFVRHMYGGRVGHAIDDKSDDSSTTTAETVESDLLHRYDSFDDSISNELPQHSHIVERSRKTTEKEESSQTSSFERFWTEQEESAEKYISMIPVIVPRQEILACSMTA